MVACPLDMGRSLYICGLFIELRWFLRTCFKDLIVVCTLFNYTFLWVSPVKFTKVKCQLFPDVRYIYFNLAKLESNVRIFVIGHVNNGSPCKVFS
jgi:hypothetical protein